MADEPDDPDDRDELEARLDRLEATLEELRMAIAEDDRVEAGRTPASPAREAMLRMTERLVVPAAVAALEANVRALEFVQDRLREFEDRDAGTTRGPPGGISDRVLEQLDDSLARMEESITRADLPADAEARRLLERARDLNAELRGRMGDSRTGPSGPDVVRIDVEAELDDIRDEVDAQEDGEETDDGDA